MAFINFRSVFKPIIMIQIRKKRKLEQYNRFLVAVTPRQRA